MNVFCMIKFLILIMFIDKIMNIKNENSFQNSLENFDNSKFSIDDIIEYLAETEDKKDINENNKFNEMEFLEKKLTQSDRGKGCEAKNNCSGKGTCINGQCKCDKGYDYSDCSVNLQSKNNFF